MTTPAGAAAGEFVDVEEWTWRARVQLFMRWAGKLADPWLDWRVRPLSGGNQTDGCVARQAEMPVLVLLQCMRSALAGLAWSSQQPDAACRPLLVLKSVCLSVCPTHRLSQRQRFAPGVLQREPHTRRASEALILLLLCCSAPSLSPAQPSQQPLHVPPRSCFRPQSYLPITIFIAAAVNHDNPTIDASAPTTCRSSSALALAARTRPLRYAT